jgi:hypothetical protein
MHTSRKSNSLSFPQTLYLNLARGRKKNATLRYDAVKVGNGLNVPRNWRTFTRNDEVLLVFFWQLYSYQSAALYTTTYIKQEQAIKIENDRQKSQNNCCDR